MKRTILCLFLLILGLALFASETSTPRVFIQKLVLDNGTNPKITVIKDKSAPEYKLQAWILERPKEILNTEKNNTNFLSVSQIGDGVNMPYFVACKLNLGNFNTNWKAGETLHLKLTHKKTKKTIEWNVVIPEGNTLIKMLDEPKVVPPYSPKKN